MSGYITTALLAAGFVLGLRVVAGRLALTNDHPALWTGLALMTTAWAADIRAAILLDAVTVAFLVGAGIRLYRSGLSVPSVDVDVSFDDDGDGDGDGDDGE